ncbi:MAG: hypothetical protein K6F65_06535, partial [Lachnospiraceae bacterium]|nr:hypothetical protein [Lachnospiraceae bacterium]
LEYSGQSPLCPELLSPDLYYGYNDNGQGRLYNQCEEMNTRTKPLITLMNFTAKLYRCMGYKSESVWKTSAH